METNSTDMGDTPQAYEIRAKGQCVHTRLGQQGCSACLDLCPVEAITSNGDFVQIDAEICTGCGACAAICPANAVLQINPPESTIYEQISALAQSHTETDGQAPRLLVYDQKSNLPANLPFDRLLAVENLNGFNHVEMLFALTAGFATVDIIIPALGDIALTAQINLANTLTQSLGGNRFRLIGPDDVTEQSKTSAPQHLAINPAKIANTHRETLQNIMESLVSKGNQPQDLPAKAPYGSIQINSEKCTFCLACTNLCPTGALAETPEPPQILFQESNCIQCGLCSTGCPENVIQLVPRFNIEPDANQHIPLHQAEPFTCIACGAEFGTKSTIEKIISMLESKNAAFDHSANTRLICMCDACKLKAQHPIF